jgi:hypothetical protein
MRKLKWLFIFLLMSLQFIGRSQQPEYIASIHKMKYEECISILGQYKDRWRADSLALNGSREILGWEFIKSFDSLIGTEWKVINELLGNPDLVFKETKEPGILRVKNIYRYILNAVPGEGKNQKNLGIKVLEFRVADGKITDLRAWENDG